MLIGLAIALGMTAVISQPSYAQRNRFFCDTSQNEQGKTVPATMASTPGQGNVPMIVWVRNDFQGSYTQQQRCEEVASRFQRHYENRTLKFIRTGSINGYPVLCIASSKGGSCPKNQVLITLSPGTDPKPVLTQLLDLRRKVGGTPVYLSGSRTVFYEEGETYVDVEKLLGIPPSSEPVEPLWEM